MSDLSDHEAVHSAQPFIPPPPPPEEKIPEEQQKYPSRRLTSRSGQSLPCFICKSNPSKYKFKCCLFGYCSVACFKIHADCSAASADPAPRRRFIDPFADLDMPPEDVVSQSQLARLRVDADVRKFLEHPKVRKLLLRIDSARDRHAALERCMQTDAAFATVVAAIAKVVGADLTQ